ncbi:MAG: hypothetical protein DMF63_11990 [Acidobacteria bacterium]|nr:MAG: hypothetical protein DMF63_11990 [Acidobacteriota bacterium]
MKLNANSVRVAIGRITIVTAIIAAILSFYSFAPAQTDERTKAVELIKAQKFTEALPLLEKISKALPEDGEIQFYLGFALVGQATNTADKTVAQQMRARARLAFVGAKQLHFENQILDAMIESIPVDGGEESKYSQNPDAEKFMAQGEAAFSRGEMEIALNAYKKALELDPKLYYAALFSGDVHTQLGKYPEAEIWYQKAIAIDPNIETAFRYSATPLMKLGKTDQARDRYVEAFIVEPYSRLALSGIAQWGEATNTPLGHPKLDIPETTVGPDGKQSTTINVSPVSDDASMAWIAYTATRAAWKKEKFAKTFPAEKTYRHTLAEEADALRSVLKMAKSVKYKTLNPQISLIEQMDKDGVLEAYVLMAIPDSGIARDHAAYLRSNREKLRLYVVKYVIGGK